MTMRAALIPPSRYDIFWRMDRISHDAMMGFNETTPCFQGFDSDSYLYVYTCVQMPRGVRQQQHQQQGENGQEGGEGSLWPRRSSSLESLPGPIPAGEYSPPPPPAPGSRSEPQSPEKDLLDRQPSSSTTVLHQQQIQGQSVLFKDHEDPAVVAEQEALQRNYDALIEEREALKTILDTKVLGLIQDVGRSIDELPQEVGNFLDLSYSAALLNFKQ